MRPELRKQMGCLNIDGRNYPLYEGINTIGRNKDATVIVRDPSVSQQHAIITIVNDNQHFVSDLRSFNGTIIQDSKLNPLLLYQLPLETVINFAKCKALYKKVPGNSQSITIHNNYGLNMSATQETQSLTESFYTAATQNLINIPTPTKDSTDFEGPTNYFEDDYNFSEIPSPPMDDLNQLNKTGLSSTIDKSSISIHEMPTQLYCSDVANDIVIGEDQASASSNMDYQIISTKVDVHELPTQMICYEAVPNESVDKTQSQSSLQGSSLHDMPTQIIDEVPHDLSSDDKSMHPTNKNSDHKSLGNNIADTLHCDKKRTEDISLDQTSASSNMNHQIISTKVDVHELPTQMICHEAVDKTQSQSSLQGSSLHNMPTQIKVPHDISSDDKSMQPTNINTDDKGLGNNIDDTLHYDEERTEDISLDVIEESRLDDSGLDITVSSIPNNKSARGTLENTPTSSLESGLHVSQLYRRTLKPILNDTDEEIENLNTNEPVSKSKDYKDSKDIHSSEEIIKEKKKCRIIESDDSETDIEDLHDDDKHNKSNLENESAVKKEVSTTKCEQNESEKQSSPELGKPGDTNISQDIGKQKKKCHVLDDDSETDIEDLHDDDEHNESNLEKESAVKKEVSSTKCEQNKSEKPSSPELDKPGDTNISQDIGKQKKKCHVLDDDSETDIEDLHDDDKHNKSNLENESAVKKEVSSTKCEQNKSEKRSFPELDKPGDTNISQDIGKQKKKCHVLDDDSETDIEDFEDTINPPKILDKNSCPKEGSISNKNPVDNETDKNTVTLQSKTETNNSDSDTDADYFEFAIKNKAVKEKVAENKLITLNDSEVIPATQASDNDSDDDFNFIPESNSTLVTRHNSEQTKEHIFDVSQKLKELRRTSVAPQSYSEESLHLGLSEVMENSENLKDLEKQVSENKNEEEDDDKTPDISDVDEPCMENDIFKKSLQKDIVDEKNNEAVDVFAMATQELTDIVLLQTKKDKEIFAKPITSKCFSNIKKHSESQNEIAKCSHDIDDDLFMQPTQPLVANNDKESLFKMKCISTANSSADNEDIFIQSTQKIEENNQDVQSKSDDDGIGDDIFMQPTQQVVSTNKSIAVAAKNQLDNIFMEPTQQIISNECNKPALGNKTQTTDDIFMQPTQEILSNERLACNKPELGNKKQTKSTDDIFMQPTQQIVSNEVLENEPSSISDNKSIVAPVKDKHEDDIFMQPTQVFSVAPITIAKVGEESGSKADTDKNDLFMQETQELILPDVTPIPDCNLNKTMQTPRKFSLSLQKDATKRTKFDDVESQMEVMFASQTLRMSSQTNSRPSNPLANVLGGNLIDNSEHNIDNAKEELDEIAKNEDVKLSESDNSLDNSDDLKKYGEMPTLPMDELSDIQTSSHKVKEKPKQRVQFAKMTTSVPPQETTVSSTPRKRGRPSETTKTANIVNTTRKLRKTRVTSSDENITDGKVQEPTPGISSGDIKQKDDEIVAKKKSTREVKKKDQDKSNSCTNKDNEVEMLEKNKTKIETNLKRKLRSNRVVNTNITKNKPDEACGDPVQNASKSTTSILGHASTTISDIQNSETEEEDDKQEMMTIRTRTHIKRKLTKPLNVSDRTRRKEPEKNENIPSTTQKHTNERVMRSKKEDTSSSNTSNKMENVAVSIQKLKANDAAQIISISDDSSNSDLEKSNATTSTTTKRGKITKTQTEEKKMTVSKIQQEVPPSTSSAPMLNTRNTRVASKKLTTPTKPMQTRRKNINLETSDEEPASADLKSSNTSVLGNRRGKRVLSKNNDTGKTKSPKKMKNNETSENDIESTSDSSEFNLQTPRRSTTNLNVTSSTPDRNKRIQKPKVVFTMLNSPELESLVRRLGGMVVDSVNACTVLVTGSLKRSQKLLSAVGEGKPICSPTWLQECKKANKFLDAWDYILEDEEAENKWNFTLKESLNRSKNKKLLQEFTILLAVTEATDVLKGAIESSGGKCITRVSPKNMENNLIVVANPNKKASYSKFLKQKPPPTVVAPEAIFDGVLRQELHWEDHILS